MQKKQKIILSFLILVAVGVFSVWFMGRGKESTDDAIIQAHTVPISAKVSGYVVELQVEDNQKIRQGDVIVQIDPTDYQLKVDAAKAAVLSAETTVRNAQINARRQQAIGSVAGTQKDIDNAVSQLATSQANLDNAKAMLAIAEKDLTDTKVVSPIDGIITRRTVENGAYITPGMQLLVVVGMDRWVEANFKEVQITHMKPGQRAQIKVDAYPHLTLNGHIDSIQSGTGARFSAFPPENATGNFVKVVQRVPVKILIDDRLPDDIVLGPGLSVIPTVYLEKGVKR